MIIIGPNQEKMMDPLSKKKLWILFDSMMFFPEEKWALELAPAVAVNGVLP